MLASFCTYNNTAGGEGELPLVIHAYNLLHPPFLRASTSSPDINLSPPGMVRALIQWMVVTSLGTPLYSSQVLRFVHHAITAESVAGQLTRDTQSVDIEILPIHEGLVSATSAAPP